MKMVEEIEEFVLRDQDRKDFRLSEQRGKRVLLSFHPLAWTPVCAKQMKSLEENSERFERLNTVAVGVSVDSTFTKKAWAESLGIDRTRLLSDFWPHGGVAKMLGVFREEEGISERANTIVDEEGKVVFKKVYPLSQVPDLEEILEFLSGD
ncbi:MAG: redoxin domain-containing protein [Thermoplasmata archaeon]|nr:redoxin domain-containing protein [Thermoplasmata archaeon]